MRGVTFAICGFLALAIAAVQAAAVEAAAAQAQDCPGNPDAIGTSRTIVVDPAEHRLVGSMQYRESLPLEDHEVVLTFDDGPIPPYSKRVLDILASECVKANYFLVGQMAKNFPDMVRRIHEAGHTIGTHSENHPLIFTKMSLARAEQEINDGIAAVTRALDDGTAPAPFFRFPGLGRSDGVERYLASQHLMTWSADFPADDWTKISPAEVYARALRRIEVNHKGILLLHDIHERTVEALPTLLRELKRRGYRIVHVVATTPDLPKTATDPHQWVMHPRQVWAPAPAYEQAGTDPELPAPSPASFGFANPADLRSLLRGPVSRPRTGLVRGQVPLPPVSIWPRGLNEEAGPAAAGVPPAPPASGRPVLPAPSPQNFGYPGEPEGAGGLEGPDDAPRAPTPGGQRKASLDRAPTPSRAAPDIRPMVPAVTYDDMSTGSVVRRMPPAPTATEKMPHGAFP
jgi:peptidoglycan/xylan/chitin deacetylase (PgdA/CDA1 family)